MTSTDDVADWSGLNVYLLYIELITCLALRMALAQVHAGVDTFCLSVKVGCVKALNPINS